MTFFIIAGLIVSLSLNVALAGYLYIKNEEKIKKVVVPTEKQLTTDDIFQLIVLVREHMNELRLSRITIDTSEEILDWDIIETKLKYAHADAAERFGRRRSTWKLADLPDLPEYTKEELDELYQVF